MRGKQNKKTKQSQTRVESARRIHNRALRFAAMLFLDSDRQIGAEAFCSVLVASTADGHMRVHQASTPRSSRLWHHSAELAKGL
jgi:ribosomal protein L21